jgi:hypothetical protein
MMQSLLPILLCVGIIVVLLAVNYVLVTLQERREGEAPYWTLEEIDGDAASDEQLQTFITRGKKIEAIKRYRELTAVGLKEAKDAIELIILNPDILGEKKKAPRLDLDDAPGVRDLIDEGRDDEAVNIYQKFAGVDEFTARDMVDKIKREMGSE